jgi:hypothetical protein
MLPMSHWEYSIAERQMELQKLMNQQQLLQCLGSVRKHRRPIRFLRTVLSVVRLPVDVFRSVHVMQHESAVSSRKRSTGVCETRLS